MFKQKFKNLLNKYGYTIYQTKTLPFGCNFKEDINRITPNLKLKNIIDVGANKGQTALSFRQKFPDAKIFSFEPVIESFEILKKNTNSDPNIFCFNLALGENNKQESMIVQGTSGSNCIQDSRDFNLQPNQSLETINMVTLDDFLDNCDHKIDQIDLLKIDTEGYECEVLKGAKTILKSDKIFYILSEVTFREHDKHHTHFCKLNNLLKEYNFNFIALYDVRPYWGGGNAVDYCNVLFKKWEKGKNLKLWEI